MSMMHFWLCNIKLFEAYMKCAATSSSGWLRDYCAMFIQELTDILSETRLTKQLYSAIQSCMRQQLGQDRFKPLPPFSSSECCT